MLQSFLFGVVEKARRWLGLCFCAPSEDGLMFHRLTIGTSTVFPRDRERTAGLNATDPPTSLKNSPSVRRNLIKGFN